MNIAKYFVISMIVCMNALPAFPCTAVFANKTDVKLIGRTMDWPTGAAIVVKNLSGINKNGAAIQDKSVPIKWTSSYGSITFNLKVHFPWYIKLIAKFMHLPTNGPSCGMNEKGLWGGSFWVHTPPSVVYQKKDGRISINDWQLLEYILDTSSTVQEALDKINNVRVSGFKEAALDFDLHWYFADNTGDSAIVEFPDGNIKIHRRPNPTVITNSFYEHSHEYLGQFAGFGGIKPIDLKEGEMTSENRMVFASYILKQAMNRVDPTPADIFAVMKAATQTDSRHMSTSQSVTQWTTVYDLNDKTLSWFSRSNSNIKTIDMKKIDFTKGSNRTVNINYIFSGDVTNKFN
jgi:penicillin V acylase-like amidase (Ntn superfamily)